MEEDKEEHLEDLSLSDSESVMTGNIPYDSEESSSEDEIRNLIWVAFKGDQSLAGQERHTVNGRI